MGIDQANLMALARPVDAHKPFNLFRHAQALLLHHLVEGMRGAAARPGLAAISITDLKGYVSRRVKELTGGNQSPVMAMPKTVEDYWIAQRLN